MEALLSVLELQPQGMHIRDMESGVARYLKLSTELTTKVQRGKRTVLGYKLAWARTKCRKEGKIEPISPSKWRLVHK